MIFLFSRDLQHRQEIEPSLAPSFLTRCSQKETFNVHLARWKTVFTKMEASLSEEENQLVSALISLQKVVPSVTEAGHAVPFMRHALTATFMAAGPHTSPTLPFPCTPYLQPSATTQREREREREREMKIERWEKVSSRRLAIIFLFLLISTATPSDGREWNVAGEGGGAGGHESAVPFLLKDSRVVSKTEGGEIRVFKGPSWNGRPSRMLISFVSMEANTLLIPHYMDADLILFVLKGEAKAGWIQEDDDDLVERQLKPGDVLQIPAGSTFYFVNTRKDQKLQFIATVEPAETDLIGGWFSAFFIDGGKFPPSFLAGFDISTLTSAFNATPEEVGVLKSVSFAGSIIFNTDNEANHLRKVTSDMKSEMKRLKQSRPLIQNSDEKTVSWTTILSSIFFGETAKEKNKGQRRASDPVEAPDAYNAYDREPDFKNDYGWSVEINGDDYLPLKQSDISITLLSLSAGSMMAPHMNPRATEYAVVISGAGTVEVVYPNGTQAMKAEVREGDVFWVPRFYPFCQVAAREKPMEILGFTTSWRRSRPQFLVGKSSILRKIMGSELAAGFGITEEKLRKLVTKQNESMILPSGGRKGVMGSDGVITV